ncbi:hypothetical protein [Tateyamaria sp.]|uniref:hypothetical protein n=1 Tax=Tateyamaria sp. TaxID=1929288 RepID=UPI00329C3467
MSELLKPGRDNWYRNEQWSFDIESAFLTKLNRTRGQGHQYLRIQADHLVDYFPLASLRLIDLYFERWSDPFSDGSAYVCRSQAQVVLHQLERAADSLEAAMAWQISNPNHQIGAEKKYCLLVAEHAMKNRYAIAKQLLSQADLADEVFPLGRFELSAASALISADDGELDSAEYSANRAILEADTITSGFPRHSKAGLVTEGAARLVSSLKRLAQREEPE